MPGACTRNLLRRWGLKRRLASNVNGALPPPTQKNIAGKGDNDIIQNPIPLIQSQSTPKYIPTAAHSPTGSFAQPRLWNHEGPKNLMHHSMIPNVLFSAWAVQFMTIAINNELNIFNVVFHYPSVGEIPSLVVVALLSLFLPCHLFLPIFSLSPDKKHVGYSLPLPPRSPSP